LNLEIIGRHVEITPDVREFVAQRVEKLGKFFDRVHSLKVVIAVEGTNHRAEFVAHLVKSDTVVSRGSAADVYGAVEIAADKLEHQLRRYKEKLRNHRAKQEEEPSEGGAQEA